MLDNNDQKIIFWASFNAVAGSLLLAGAQYAEPGFNQTFAMIAGPLLLIVFVACVVILLVDGIGRNLNELLPLIHYWRFPEDFYKKEILEIIRFMDETKAALAIGYAQGIGTKRIGRSNFTLDQLRKFISESRMLYPETKRIRDATIKNDGFSEQQLSDIFLDLQLAKLVEGRAGKKYTWKIEREEIDPALVSRWDLKS